MMMMIKFLVLSLVVISPISIYAGKELMIRECHNAQVPTICMQCLESHPKSVSADPVGIAGIVVNCLDSHLHILTRNITTLLLSKKEHDKAIFKILLERCKEELSNATTKLPVAMNGLETGDYDKAGQSIEVALGFSMRCKYGIQHVKFEFPQLYSQLNIYAQLSDAAMRIIDRFS